MQAQIYESLDYQYQREIRIETWYHEWRYILEDYEIRVTDSLV